MFVSDGCNLNNAQIYINPHILYNGSNAHLVEILSVFCKKNESKISAHSSNLRKVFSPIFQGFFVAQQFLLIVKVLDIMGIFAFFRC